MESVASASTRWVDRTLGVPGAAALGVMLAALAWQRASWTPGLELEALPGWAALVPMRAPLLPEVVPHHEALFAVVADPTEALLALPGDMRCGDAEMGGALADSGRYGVAGPPDNADPHLARPAWGRGYPTAHGVTTQGIGFPQTQSGSPGPTAPFGRDAALGTDAKDAHGRMWADELNEDEGEDGLGLAGLAGGVAKRFDVTPVGASDAAKLRVVHTGLRVTGARQPSEVGRVMAAHFDDLRACAARAKDAGDAQPPERILLAFDVAEDGRVAATGESSGALWQCLEQSVSRIAFTAGARAVTHVEYPLYFVPADVELTSARVTPTPPVKACGCDG